MQNNFGFTRWNFQYEIDGDTTLDDVRDAGLLRRIAARRSLFMQPLIDSGYLDGKSILDIGCNSGFWSYLPVRFGGAAHVHGIDASPELIEQAKFAFERNGVDQGQYRFEVADAYEFLSKSAPQMYDVVLCLGFFYHINDPMQLLSLMSRICRDFVIIDTVVHNAPEALISVRPVQKKPNYVESANIGLELVSSPKAIYWMSEETKFVEARTLTGSFKGIQSMWDYIRDERAAFVLSKGPSIESVWTNTMNPGYLSTREDLARHGYFPEIHPEGRNRVAPLIPRSLKQS